MGLFSSLSGVFTGQSQWKPQDSSRHTKLVVSARLQQQWTHVANGAILRGATRADAVRKANGVVLKTLKAAIERPVRRDSKQKREFLKQQGYSDGKAPAGFHVDHREPLCWGGHDRPHNMTLLPEAKHRAKTASDMETYRELKRRVAK